MSYTAAGLVGVLAMTNFCFAGELRTAPLRGDADAGIDAANRYTHAINFAGPDVTINGVTFQGGPDNETGANYSTSNIRFVDIEGRGGADLTGTDRTTYVTGDVAGLLTDYYHSFAFGYPAVEAKLTLTGIEPGTPYRTSFYWQGFNGPPGNRSGTITGSDDATPVRLDQNMFNLAIEDPDPVDLNRRGVLVTYDYLGPEAGEITYTFVADNGNNSFQHYSFSNHVLPEASAGRLMVCGIVGLLGLRRRRSGLPLHGLAQSNAPAA